MIDDDTIDLDEQIAEAAKLIADVPPDPIPEAVDLPDDVRDGDIGPDE